MFLSSQMISFLRSLIFYSSSLQSRLQTFFCLINSNSSQSIMFLANSYCVLFYSFRWILLFIFSSTYFFFCTSSVFALIASFFSLSSSMFLMMLLLSQSPEVDLNYWQAWFLSTFTIFFSILSTFFVAATVFQTSSSNSSLGMLIRLEMFRVGLASFTALPAPKPKLCSYWPTLTPEDFFQPPSFFFCSYCFSCLGKELLAISLTADL